MWRRLPPLFAYRNCMVSGLTSAIQCELIVVYGVIWWPVLILLHMVVQFSQHHFFLKRLFFPHCVLLALLLWVNCPYPCGFFLGSLGFHWSVCLPLCQYRGFFFFFLRESFGEAERSQLGLKPYACPCLNDDKTALKKIHPPSISIVGSVYLHKHYIGR